MPVKRIPENINGDGRRIGVVVSRFNAAIADALLAGALRALNQSGVAEDDILVLNVPGALEAPLVLQRLAQSGDYDGLVALGAVIRGDTYHFDIVSNESAAGVASVQLEFGIPIGNGILTTETEEQAMARADLKGFQAAQAALEIANLLDAIDDED